MFLKKVFPSSDLIDSHSKEWYKIIKYVQKTMRRIWTISQRGDFRKARRLVPL